MKMKEFFSKKKNIDIIVFLEALAAMAMAVLAIHDTNTATGAGYLLYISSGSMSRGAWNIILDLCIIAAMLVLIAVPAFILKTGLGSTSLFFLGACAFSSYLRPDRLLAPFMGGEIISRADARVAVISWLPAGIVCAAVLLTVFSVSEKNTVKIPAITGAVSAACLVLSVLTPASEIFLFAAGYFVAIPFLAADKCKEGTSDMLVLRLIPASVMFLCGIWRLFMVLSAYHM